MATALAVLGTLLSAAPTGPAVARLGGEAASTALWPWPAGQPANSRHSNSRASRRPAALADSPRAFTDGSL